jgi:hypothetical protein
MERIAMFVRLAVGMADEYETGIERLLVARATMKIHAPTVVPPEHSRLPVRSSPHRGVLIP